MNKNIGDTLGSFLREFELKINFWEARLKYLQCKASQKDFYDNSLLTEKISKMSNYLTHTKQIKSELDKLSDEQYEEIERKLKSNYRKHVQSIKSCQGKGHFIDEQKHLSLKLHEEATIFRDIFKTIAKLSQQRDSAIQRKKSKLKEYFNRLSI